MQYTGRLSMEHVQREALMVLFAGINNMITAMNTTWQLEDNALLTALGRGASTWTVEPIANENFYPGTIPSLINAPIEKYPNLCVVCYTGTPPDSSDDTAEFYTHVMAVEIMVKSGTFDPPGSPDLTQGLYQEQQVNSRIHKTLDAAHLTLLANKNLNNTIPSLPPPNVTVGDIFVRREEGGQGGRWYWQGGSLIYNLSKYVDLY
jgi:hypothetical protein